jgi:hypothetical protein
MELRLEKKRLHCVSQASGSALKGIGFFPLTTQTPLLPPSLGLCSVGYDQRLSVWKLALLAPYITELCTEQTPFRSIAGAEDCPLEWVAGSVVNVGDVNAMALEAEEEAGEQRRVLVVGEGFQLFELRD